MSQFINLHSAVFPWHLHPAQLFALAQEYGVASQTLLGAAGLSDQDIDHGDLFISWEQYRSIAAVVDLHAPAHWGILLGQRLTTASHGLLSLAVMNCNEFHQVLELMIKFKNLVTSLFYIERRDIQNHVVLFVRPEFSRDKITSKFIECFFVSIYRSIVNLSALKEGEITRSDSFRIFLDQPSPVYSDICKASFDNNIQYNHWCCALVFKKDYLKMPIVESMGVINPTIVKNMTTLLRSRMKKMPRLVGDLHALHQQFDQQCYNLDLCAKSLNMSSTTLKRRLKQACSSFNIELMHYRSEEAYFWLSFSERPADEIALQLGFQDYGSFRRFFKAQSGLTPDSYRKSKNYIYSG